MANRSPNTRAMFYVISIITLILLLGSTALQRIVFKADQISSAVFISPASVSVKPDTKTTVRLQASVAGTALVAAAQFELSFDPSIIEVTETNPAITWQTKKIDTTDGTLRWVLLPTSSAGTVAEFSGEIIFGEITFRTLKEGRATLDLDGPGTRIVAIDPGQTPSLYNSVTSTQSTPVTISATAPAAPTASAPLPEVETPSPAGELQRFQQLQEIIGSTAVEILIAVDQSSALSIQFGPNPQTLLNSVVATSGGTSAAMELSGLDPNTRYYYQIRAEDEAGNTAMSKIRSFVTAPLVSDSTIPAELIAFPALAQKNSTVYLAENAVAGTEIPTFRVEKGAASIGAPINNGGIYQVVVSSLLTTKQTVVVVAESGGQVIGRTTFGFDPNVRSATVVPATAEVSSLPLTSKNVGIVLVLSVMLLLLGTVFYRLAKAK